ncbi:MAG: sugar phosphate isomerase/epimerase [Calditrichaeota bacterium]|nr:MAG: sugar phosphate isomerase/epimerase [Calditrichota bacterium]
MNMDMKIGFLTACFANINLEDTIKWAAQNGFKALELAVWPLQVKLDEKDTLIDAAQFNQDKALQVKTVLAAHGMEISALAYYENNIHPDLNIRAGIHQHLKKVVDMAALLDVNLVGTFVGARPDKTPKENIMEIGRVFRELVSYARDRGVKLMIENCPMENWLAFGFPGNFAYSPGLWNALFNEVSDDHFGLNLDPSHLVWLGIDYLQAVCDFHDKILHTHAKDTEFLSQGRNRYGLYGRQIDPEPWKSGWWRYRIPGLGEINWQKYIDALQANGYDSFLSIEHEDPIWSGSELKVKDGLLLGYKHLSNWII